MSNVKFLYVRNEWKKRDITIVSNLFDEEDKVFVKFAWAFRSNHDNFKKADGRKLALERLELGDVKYSDQFEINKSDIQFFKIATEILSVISNNPNTPRKYLDDIAEDLSYYVHRAMGGHSKLQWKECFDITEEK